MATWIVYAGLSVTVVTDCSSREQACEAVLDRHGLSAKPYLSRDWKAREAGPEELKRYAAHAVAYRPSQPTAKTAPKPGKPPKKTIQQRLHL